MQRITGALFLLFIAASAQAHMPAEGASAGLTHLLLGWHHLPLALLLLGAGILAMRGVSKFWRQ